MKKNLNLLDIYFKTSSNIPKTKVEVINPTPTNPAMILEKDI